MALFHILVGTLQDGIFLQGGDSLCLVNATKAGGGVGHTPRKVYPTLDATLRSAPGILAPLSPGIAAEGDHIHEGVVQGGEGVGEVGEGLVLRSGGAPLADGDVVLDVAGARAEEAADKLPVAERHRKGEDYEHLELNARFV